MDVTGRIPVNGEAKIFALSPSLAKSRSIPIRHSPLLAVVLVQKARRKRVQGADRIFKVHQRPHFAKLGLFCEQSRKPCPSFRLDAFSLYTPNDIARDSIDAVNSPVVPTGH